MSGQSRGILQQDRGGEVVKGKGPEGTAISCITSRTCFSISGSAMLSVMYLGSRFLCCPPGGTENPSPLLSEVQVSHKGGWASRNKSAGGDWDPIVLPEARSCMETKSLKRSDRGGGTGGQISRCSKIYEQRENGTLADKNSSKKYKNTKKIK